MEGAREEACFNCNEHPLATVTEVFFFPYDEHMDHPENSLIVEFAMVVCDNCRSTPVGGRGCHCVLVASVLNSA